MCVCVWAMMTACVFVLGPDPSITTQDNCHSGAHTFGRRCVRLNLEYCLCVRERERDTPCMFVCVWTEPEKSTPFAETDTAQNRHGTKQTQEILHLYEAWNIKNKAVERLRCDQSEWMECSTNKHMVSMWWFFLQSWLILWNMQGEKTSLIL